MNHLPQQASKTAELIYEQYKLFKSLPYVNKLQATLASYGMVEVDERWVRNNSLIFSTYKHLVSDYAVHMLQAWSKVFGVWYRQINGNHCFFVNNNHSIQMILPPIGSNRPAATIEECFEIMALINLDMEFDPEGKIHNVNDESLSIYNVKGITAEFSGNAYIYERDDRNNINGNPPANGKTRKQLPGQFEKNYNPLVSSLSITDTSDCLKLLNRWFDLSFNSKNKKINDEVLSYRFINEYYTIRHLLENWSGLNLEGISVRINNELVGFAIAEQLDDENSSIVVEKTLRDYKGLPQYIFTKLCERLDKKRINAYDQWKAASLRRMKLLYQPKGLSNKYTLRYKTPFNRQQVIRQGEANGKTKLVPVFKPVTRIDLNSISIIEQVSTDNSEFSKERLSLLLRNPRIRMIGCFINNILTGYSLGLIYTSVKDDIKEKRGRIYSVVVAEEYRNLDLGIELYKRIEEKLWSYGISALTVEVSEKKQLETDFYRYFGYNVYKTKSGYYYNGEDAICLKKMAPALS